MAVGAVDGVLNLAVAAFRGLPVLLEGRPLFVIGAMRMRAFRRSPTSGGGGLPHLDEISIRVPQVAADLGLMLFGRCEEHRAPLAPLGVGPMDVGNADVEEAADSVRVLGCLEDGVRFVVCGATARIDDDPTVGQRHIGRFSDDDSFTAQHVGIRPTGAIHVVGHDEVGEHRRVGGRDTRCGRTPGCGRTSACRRTPATRPFGDLRGRDPDVVVDSRLKVTVTARVSPEAQPGHPSTRLTATSW